MISLFVLIIHNIFTIYWIYIWEKAEIKYIKDTAKTARIKTRSKYALYPGFVTSKTDGETHFISSLELARLYRVKISECITVSENRPDLSRGIDLTGCIHLYPREDGNYCLPKGEKDEYKKSN